MRLLLAEDDHALGRALADGLRHLGHAVDWVEDGLHALHAFDGAPYAAAILDWNLPRMSGIEVVRTLRRRGDATPVLLLTARDALDDRVSGLDCGADDYVVKPYHPGEVVARVQAVLRRSSKKETEEKILRWQTLAVDVAAIVACVDNGDDAPVMLDLTPTEFSLLATLLRSPAHPFSRQYLLEHCLPESEALERVVDTHIYNLRKKLEAVGISGVLINVRGVGYRFRQP